MEASSPIVKESSAHTEERANERPSIIATLTAHTSEDQTRIKIKWCVGTIQKGRASIALPSRRLPASKNGSTITRDKFSAFTPPRIYSKSRSRAFFLLYKIFFALFSPFLLTTFTFFIIILVKIVNKEIFKKKTINFVYNRFC